MKTLLLLRHGKSDWADPDLSDHERPLSARGVEAAHRIGRYLAAPGRPWRAAHAELPFDLVLSSSARRAVVTLELVLAELAPPPPGTGETAPEIVSEPIPIEREHGLYLCGQGVLLERLRDLPEPTPTVLVVGHNPDLQDLALTLLPEGTRGRAEIKRKYPTGALAVLGFAVERWREIGPDTAHLITFTKPKRLKTEDDDA